MKANEYQCAVCKGVFERGLTEEEAVEQLQNQFPGWSKENCDLWCDDCYKKEFEK